MEWLGRLFSGTSTRELSHDVPSLKRVCARAPEPPLFQGSGRAGATEEQLGGWHRGSLGDSRCCKRLEMAPRPVVNLNLPGLTVSWHMLRGKLSANNHTPHMKASKQELISAPFPGPYLPRRPQRVFSCKLRQDLSRFLTIFGIQVIIRNPELEFSLNNRQKQLQANILEDHPPVQLVCQFADHALVKSELVGWVQMTAFCSDHHPRY